MRSVLALMLMMSSALAADGFVTVDEYQADFATAAECLPVDGRRLWRGSEGYYIQSWLFQTGASGLLDDETATAVPFKDNAVAALAVFASACD